jgi:hypothetical protein
MSKIKKIEITLTRVYKKEVKVVLNKDIDFLGLSNDEIEEKLADGGVLEDDVVNTLFDKEEEYQQIDTPEEFDGDSNRYDITYENGETYGGHSCD